MIYSMNSNFCLFRPRVTNSWINFKWIISQSLGFLSSLVVFVVFALPCFYHSNTEWIKSPLLRSKKTPGNAKAMLFWNRFGNLFVHFSKCGTGKNVKTQNCPKITDVEIRKEAICLNMQIFVWSILLCSTVNERRGSLNLRISMLTLFWDKIRKLSVVEMQLESHHTLFNRHEEFQQNVFDAQVARALIDKSLSRTNVIAY